MKRLIVNADDFGLAPAVTDGILDAHRDGLVTSTSLLVTGEDSHRAIELGRREEALAVGVHLCLVETSPTLPASEIPSLVGADGRFLPDHRAVARRWARGRLRLSEVEAELRNQIRAARASGLEITHLDSHQHLHLLPGLFALTARLCGELAIPRIRLPLSGYREALPFALPHLVLEMLARRARRRLVAMAEPPEVCDDYRGRNKSCKLTERDILNILDSLRPGTTELMCHPGRADARLVERYSWGRCWHRELAALTSPAVRRRAQELGIELVATLGQARKS